MNIYTLSKTYHLIFSKDKDLVILINSKFYMKRHNSSFPFNKKTLNLVNIYLPSGSIYYMKKNN